MIIALLCTALLGYCLGVLRRDATATSQTASDQHAARVLRPLGLEDDPVLWPTARNGWTALDERQLIRLLRDSAP